MRDYRGSVHAGDGRETIHLSSLGQRVVGLHTGGGGKRRFRLLRGGFECDRNLPETFGYRRIDEAGSGVLLN